MKRKTVEECTWNWGDCPMWVAECVERAVPTGLTDIMCPDSEALRAVANAVAPFRDLSKDSGLEHKHIQVFADEAGPVALAATHRAHGVLAQVRDTPCSTSGVARGLFVYTKKSGFTRRVKEPLHMDFMCLVKPCFLLPSLFLQHDRGVAVYFYLAEVLKEMQARAAFEWPGVEYVTNLVVEDGVGRVEAVHAGYPFTQLELLFESTLPMLGVTRTSRTAVRFRLDQLVRLLAFIPSQKVCLYAEVSRLAVAASKDGSRIIATGVVNNPEKPRTQYVEPLPTKPKPVPFEWVHGRKP